MRKLNGPTRKRFLMAFISGVLLNGIYKIYLYTTDREQFEDSNALVSIVFIVLATLLIFLILELISHRSSSK